ncbi:MAG: glycosyltransferase family 39 protein [Desulfarculaceae bacterium]|nr:glycosyltransferase family 39 protein [Desulfarculaceae bacterium]MCF8073344.1 glycosyltransferase family 39 protein [Desulfarculaceae bacterium]MCF8103220.1 glycosyltransferase family 39 protein [Desulfarculaceae bacterium]MCF8116604.1 glycosyltransferase family 39 protein [Desulfarculaceae bacterium]
MRLNRQIPPRRVVLALLLLLGLLLRLWGLDWEAPAPGSGLAEDWGWRVIAALGWSQPWWPGLWPQAFFSLSALVQGGATFLAGGLSLLAGDTRFLTELALDPRLAGRLTSALLGAAQIPLVYLLGRRCFDSVATGLLAAALVAVSPLLVAQAHYLSPATGLGLLLLLAAWLAWSLMERPRPGLWAGLGLVMGLAAATHAMGVGVWPVGLAAVAMVMFNKRAPAPQRLLLWPLCLLGGLVLGLALGAPALWLEPWEISQAAAGGLGLKGPLGPWLARGLARLAGQGRLLLGPEGVILGALWLIGVAVLIKRGLKRRLVVALAPLPLVLLGGLPAGLGMQAWTAAWLPGLAAAAAWPLVLLCRKLPAFSWQVAAVTCLVVGVVLAGGWGSAGVSYLFWQQGTAQSARFWLGANLPPKAEVFLGPGVPLDLFPGARLWRPEQPPGQGYLVVNHAWPEGGPGGAELARRQPLKRIALNQGPKTGPWAARAGFAAGLNPPLSIYAPQERREVHQPLALPRPLVGLERNYALVYLDSPAYSRDTAGALLSTSGSRARRVMRPAGGLGAMGLRLRNLGEGLARVRLSQGLWPRQSLVLYPGQQRDLVLPARAWPPVVNGLYPLGVELSQGGPLWARLVADPLLLGEQALEDGRWEAAAGWLGQAAQREESFEALAMWAGALARAGKTDQAARVLARLDGRVAGEYAALAAADPGPEWDAALERLTGYHPGLLRQAASITFKMQGPLCLSGQRPLSLSGRGYTGSFFRPHGQEGGVLVLRPAAPWPQGSWRAELNLKAPPGHEPRQVLVRVSIWARASLGASLAARQDITAGDLESGRISLPFVLEEDGASLELRLEFTTPQTLGLEQVVLAADIRAHMRAVLAWYQNARGLVALKDKEYKAAVEAFQEQLKLAPGSAAAYLPLAQSLVEVGDLEAAWVVSLRAEEAYRAFPDQLVRVAALYKALRKKEDLARVEQSQGHLRPSLQRVSRFADGLTLLGYDLPKAKVKPGGKLEINFYWRAWQPVPLDYTIYLHLRGPGRTLNYDHHLDHARVAMPTLRTGQVVREDFSLEIPADAPKGKYRVVLGLWDPELAPEAVEVVEGEDAGSRDVTLAEVEVQ